MLHQIKGTKKGTCLKQVP